MLYEIRHDSDVSTMPPSWDFWKERLDWRTVRVYEQLCKPAFADQAVEVPPNVMAQQCGISRTAVTRCLDELEMQDFLALYTEDGVCYVTVYTPPEVTHIHEAALDLSEAEERTKQTDMARKDRLSAASLVKLWGREFEKSTGTKYRAEPADIIKANQLIRQNPEIRDFEALIVFHWQDDWVEEKCKFFTDFCREFDDVASRKKDYDEGKF